MNKAFCQIVLVVASCWLSSVVSAAELDLNLNDDAVRLTYAWDVPNRNLKMDAGWLNHQDRGDILHLGLHLTGEASGGAQPVLGGLGGRIVYVDADRFNTSATALALGGFLRYTLPQYDRINLYAHGYFAPDVLSFGDGEQYQEIEARVGYNVLRDADVYIGVRYASVGFDFGGDATIDNGFIVGIQLRF